MEKIEQLITHLPLGTTLYYPGSGTDYGPLKIFSQNSFIKKIIYCDYDDYEFDGKRERINEMIGSAELSILNDPMELTHNSLNQNNWEAFWPNNQQSLSFSNPTHAFILSYKLEALNGNKIDFMYFNTEAITTFDLLLQNNVRPDLIVLQDHGFGGNWDSFGGEICLLLSKAGNNLPKYLFVAENTKKWPGYKQTSEYSIQEGQMHNYPRALFILENH